MIEKVDCFLPFDDTASRTALLQSLQNELFVQNIFLLTPTGTSAPEGFPLIATDRLLSSDTLLHIARHATAPYTLLFLDRQHIAPGQNMLRRLALTAAHLPQASMIYSDFYTATGDSVTAHPVIDYQEGSLRNDFDFGSLVLIRTALLHDWVKEWQHEERTPLHHAGWYDLRLFLSRQGTLQHLDEYLYTAAEPPRHTGEQQFDYVDPRNRAVQIEMEQVVTRHLHRVQAFISPANRLTPDFQEQSFSIEASVIIPVYNRERTIADAVLSAVSQQTDFPFNIIVVDNHSTDRTTTILQELAACHPNLIHLIPESTSLAIGGCWNEAVNDLRCGRFAVQLDSDDLYSSPHTLQTIVDAFYEQQAAMVIGSYRMCDFELQTLPPGLIDHAEWSDDNGANNALRINGLGAPRAFFTPLLRQIGFPNTGYGEDYAVGLAFCREYKIGRIYQELYLCRRWTGNSDHALSIEKENRNNLYKDRLRTIEFHARRQLNIHPELHRSHTAYDRFFERQLSLWSEVRLRYRALQSVQVRRLECDTPQHIALQAQYNPARIRSTGATVTAQAIAERPCFLCAEHLPQQQISMPLPDHYRVLVNPYPIWPVHFTIPATRHQPQSIHKHFSLIPHILKQDSELTVFYNGALCGASAPDHFHLQAGKGTATPLQSSWGRLSKSAQRIYGDDNHFIASLSQYICPAFFIQGRNADTCTALFTRLYRAMSAIMPHDAADPLRCEPMMNIFAWTHEDNMVILVFPRSKHRPDCYTASDSGQLLISPGAIDMAGLLITPHEADFQALSYDRAAAILQEVSISCDIAHAITEQLTRNHRPDTASFLHFEDGQPTVSVGIMSGRSMRFQLHGTYIAKGVSTSGAQVVEFSEGGVLWNGNCFRELTFHPQQGQDAFTLDDVTIGIDFHWERKESQTFLGALKFVVEQDKIHAINILPIERYLESVISSEMSAGSSLELLKAHAVISRSWLVAQMKKRHDAHRNTSSDFFSFTKTDRELIRWYDREDHAIFDVCADDHCQRYQGITKETSPHVRLAVQQTCGEILSYGNEICDARFSKCCGGVSEEFQYCWENIRKPYLSAVRDLPGNPSPLPDLSDEQQAVQWINTAPDSFCHTQDREILGQVLNDFDQETKDFYRWTVEYSQAEIVELLRTKLKLHLGSILSLRALERGRSGRIVRLEISGTEGSFVIGKELEIRRALSPSHLYSSAFVAEALEPDDRGIPTRFLLRGAGWGHGVGLCQIGAAVMGARGYLYRDILQSYYQGADIQKLYPHT